jgi:hypothetical protein
MWTCRTEELSGVYGLRCAIDLDSRPATFADVVRGWRDHAAFRSLFNSLLADAPFAAFRWELPAVTAASMTGPFECVVLDDPDLDRTPDRRSFAKYFAGAENGVAVFPNLGGDAVLVVPCPVANAQAYGHLGAFVRLAPETQRDTLWRTVGEAMAKRVGSKPVWLSTAGAGVPWLHVRLDDRPKYYGFRPYRRSAGPGETRGGCA